MVKNMATAVTPTGSTGQLDVTLKSYLQLIGDNNAGKNSEGFV